jgi:hypothetical protein
MITLIFPRLTQKRRQMALASLRSPMAARTLPATMQVPKRPPTMKAHALTAKPAELWIVP